MAFGPATANGRIYLGGAPRLCGRFRPHEWKVDDRPRLFRNSHYLECGTQNRPLTFDVVRLSHRPRQRISDGRQPGYADGRGEGGNHRQRYGRDARRFEDSLDQSHGPAAERSGGDEDRGIDALPFIRAAMAGAVTSSSSRGRRM